VNSNKLVATRGLSGSFCTTAAMIVEDGKPFATSSVSSSLPQGFHFGLLRMLRKTRAPAHQSLLDISVRSGIGFDIVRSAANHLLAAGLLEECPEHKPR